MFEWLKRKPPPNPTNPLAPSPGNPGQGTQVSLNFDNGARSWTEEVDLVSCLTEVLVNAGHDLSKEKSAVRLNSGLLIKPGFVDCRLNQRGATQSVTTIEVSHPSGIPGGVFEFQHSNGKDARHSVTRGFEDWTQLDLPVFVTSLVSKSDPCPCLQIEQPAEHGKPAWKRRIVLGPVSHYATDPAPAQEEEHPFCPCCLFTRSLEGFKPRIEDGQFYGIRLYAARDGSGEAAADCRLNGLDFEPGKRALIEYVKTWPPRGLEFRKQYVILQNPPVPGAAETASAKPDK